MLSLKHVSKAFGSVKVFENINLEARSGSVVCVSGKSGSGKSTLLKTISLIVKPDLGSVIIDGIDTIALEERSLDEIRRKRISYSFQEPLLMPYMTALENITEVIHSQEERTIEILSEIGLSQRILYKPANLSVGERKRVDIARAFLKGSPILVADEPCSNLDPDSGKKIMKLLREHTFRQGMTIYSSVNPNEAEFADIIVRL